MTVTNVFADKPSETDKSGQNLYDFLSSNTFGKIFILLGINEISAPVDWIAEKYKEDIDLIRKLQPNAIIVIQGNPHVSQTVSDSNPNSFNNARIDALNDKLSQLADGDYIFYLDRCRALEDETGSLVPSYSGDGIHLKAKYYSLWRDYILSEGKK